MYALTTPAEWILIFLLTNKSNIKFRFFKYDLTKLSAIGTLLDFADFLLNVAVLLERGTVFIQPEFVLLKSFGFVSSLCWRTVEFTEFVPRSISKIKKKTISILKIMKSVRLPPTSLTFRYFLSECKACQNLTKVLISSLRSESFWVGLVTGLQK